MSAEISSVHAAGERWKLGKERYLGDVRTEPLRIVSGRAARPGEIKSSRRCHTRVTSADSMT
jgi:hypothetical protein